MKAIIYHEYGLPEALKVEEAETPAPKDVLVKYRKHLLYSSLKK